ncbi:programmed cell death 1 ligand 1 isoform X1 [Maylandia zebra]|uniref:programmed cell death 1 ligand 1 isoform X1 n=1 Tax=Maylandia zebra TaxID=106582 RepID=UPI00403D33C9
MELSRIIGIKCVVLAFLWTLTNGDTEVSCVFQESCILPCSFLGSTDAVISWSLLKARHVSILSYNSKQHQLTQQDEHFRGRASLFKDQISNGNASLQLTSVEFQDEGRYKCATGGNNDSFISLKVDAPVREVNIEKAENRITCSSEGIYPEPLLTWSTSRQTVFRSTTIVQQSGPNGELYNIKSSVIFPDTKHDFTDMTYSCTVTTRSNNKTAILSNRNLKEGIAKAMVAGVIMIAVILGLIPICCNKFNSKMHQSCSVPMSVLPTVETGSMELQSHQAQQVPDAAEISSQLDLVLTEKTSEELKTLSAPGHDHEGDDLLPKAAAEPTEM